MKIKEFVKQMLSKTKTKIIDCVTEKLENEEKKQLVDLTITKWVEENMLKLSPVQSLLVTRWLMPIIPTVTQIIYDCLKQKVEGLTVNG